MINPRCLQTCVLTWIVPKLTAVVSASWMVENRNVNVQLDLGVLYVK